MKKFKRIIKQVLCVILASAFFITGCPEIFNSNIFGGVTVYAAEEWKTKLKEMVDGIEPVRRGICYEIIVDAGISSVDLETINAYLLQLLNTEDYFWLDHLMVEKSENLTYT